MQMPIKTSNHMEKIFSEEEIIELCFQRVAKLFHIDRSKLTGEMRFGVDFKTPRSLFDIIFCGEDAYDDIFHDMLIASKNEVADDLRSGKCHINSVNNFCKFMLAQYKRNPKGFVRGLWKY